jgi:hypothetical protein
LQRRFDRLRPTPAKGNNMDDYYCDIFLWGIASKDKLYKLYSLFDWPFTHDFKSFVKSAISNEKLTLPSMVGAEVSTVDTALLRSGIGYRLDVAHDMGSHIESRLWDPVLKERHSFNFIVGKPQIPIDILKSPELIAKALRGRDLYYQGPRKPLVVYETSHELMEGLNAHPEYAACVQQAT